MNVTKSKTSLLVVCGLALAGLPCAFAAHHGGAEDEMFKMMDTDGDGKVSRAEQAASAQKMFTDADANHDGMVTLAEMEAAQAKMETAHAKSDMPMKKDHAMKDEMSAAEMFKMCDQDGDGKISQAEHTKHADAMFAQMDTDKDGFLTASECAAGHKKMMQDKKSAH